MHDDAQQSEVVGAVLGRVCKRVASDTGVAVGEDDFELRDCIALVSSHKVKFGHVNDGRLNVRSILSNVHESNRLITKCCVVRSWVPSAIMTPRVILPPSFKAAMRLAAVWGDSPCLIAVAGRPQIPGRSTSS